MYAVVGSLQKNKQTKKNSRPLSSSCHFTALPSAGDVILLKPGLCSSVVVFASRGMKASVALVPA